MATVESLLETLLAEMRAVNARLSALDGDAAAAEAGRVIALGDRIAATVRDRVAPGAPPALRVVEVREPDTAAASYTVTHDGGGWYAIVTGTEVDRVRGRDEAEAAVEARS